MKIKINSLDALFSRYIRAKAGWRCERCGNKPDRRGLHVHHFHRRRKMATRYDSENCLSLCLGCHQYFHENRKEEEAFLLQKLGQDRFDMLEARSRTPQKVDVDLLTLYFEQILKELNDG